MSVTTVGLDLAKDVFQVHGVCKYGSVAFNRTIRRNQLLSFFEALPPCLVGVEACGSAHHWGRKLREIGHEVRLMPAYYVTPNVKRANPDAADPWTKSILERKPARLATVAMANKTARIIWAVLTRGTDYRHTAA